MRVEQENPVAQAFASLESEVRSSEVLNFARRGLKRGLFNLQDITERSGHVLKKFGQNFVAIHELGHVRLAKRFGWFVHEINISGNAFCRGFVRISPPPGQLAEDIIRQGAIISLGGSAATKSNEGTGSDFAQFEHSHEVAKVYNFKQKMGSKMEHQIVASISVGNESSLEDEAMELLIKAA